MVFLVLMYSGHFFWMAYWKQLCAKPEMDYGEKERSLACSPRARRWPENSTPSFHTALSGSLGHPSHSGASTWCVFCAEAAPLRNS